MTDPKAGRTAKTAFNFQHKRYGAGRKAARTNRDWAGWDVGLLSKEELHKTHRRHKQTTEESL